MAHGDWRQVWTATSNSASFENLWVELGPMAFVVFLLSWVLVRAKRLVRRVIRHA